MNMRLHRICNAAAALLLILLVFLTLLLVCPYLVGGRVYRMQSGSMEPAVSAGSLLLVDARVTPEDLRPGDIISYREEDGVLITHRLLEAGPDALLTKGDANTRADSPVPPEQLEGRLWLAIPRLGFLTGLFRTAAGIPALLVLLVLLTVLTLLPHRIKTGEAAPDQHDK